MPVNAWSRARTKLAPRGAVAIRLCRYSRLNHDPPLALVRSRMLRDHARVRRLVRELDALPRFPRGAIACPADDRRQIVALLAYPDAHVVTVTVGLRGCAAVSNGTIARTAFGFGTPRRFGPQLVRELERLTS